MLNNVRCTAYKCFNFEEDPKNKPFGICKNEIIIITTSGDCSNYVVCTTNAIEKVLIQYWKPKYVKQYEKENKKK